MSDDLGRFLFLFALWAGLWLATLVYLAKHVDPERSKIGGALCGESWPGRVLILCFALPVSIAGVILIATGISDPDWVEIVAIAMGMSLAGLISVVWSHLHERT